MVVNAASSWTIRVAPEHNIQDRFSKLRKTGETASGTMDRIFRIAEGVEPSLAVNVKPTRGTHLVLSGTSELVSDRLDQCQAVAGAISDAVYAEHSLRGLGGYSGIELLINSLANEISEVANVVRQRFEKHGF